MDFYKSQGIDSTIIRINKNDDRHPGAILDEWVLNNVKNYNHYLGTHWSSDNGSDIPSWEIEPFPEIKSNGKIWNKPINEENITLLINPSSGGTDDAKKSFSFEEVMTIYKRYFPMVHIIGQGTETRYDYLGPNSLYNKQQYQNLSI